MNSKVKRYSNLVKNFSNWASYLLFKSFKSKGSFEFKLRDGFSIDVPKKMLPPFKEIFFDEVYLKELPGEIRNKRDIVAIDIGANVGYFSLFIFSKYPDASVYAFEPMPFNYEKLKEYQQTYPAFDFKVFNQAVTNHKEGITLNSSNLDNFSTMASIFESNNRGEKINVPTTTLSDIIKKEDQIRKIDYLKMDCEGSEYSILYSSPDHIIDKIKFISLETHEGEKEDENHESLAIFLKSKGFNIKESKESGSRLGYIWGWK